MEVPRVISSESTLMTCRSYAKLPAANIDRALQFYERLGLRPSGGDGSRHFFFDCGDSRFLLYRSEGVAAGTHDQMGWFVSDIHATVDELKSRGIQFEVFDYTGNSWEGEIAGNGFRRSAWFRDSERNVLNVIQLLK
jgi:catechol 2,3-dioxygenase-like lactoylglutathione lyase family enzyme